VLYLDKDRIYQVLFNLLQNAIKYSPTKSVIHTTVEKVKDDMVVSVKDHGVGIPDEHIPKIFDRFYRVFDDRDRTFPGLGIGLYIAQEIVARHGGMIKVQSEVGKGSTFSFSLPTKSK
jgi:signal transduction histidine kinase